MIHFIVNSSYFYSVDGLNYRRVDGVVFLESFYKLYSSNSNIIIDEFEKTLTINSKNIKTFQYDEIVSSYTCKLNICFKSNINDISKVDIYFLGKEYEEGIELFNRLRERGEYKIRYDDEEFNEILRKISERICN